MFNYKMTIQYDGGRYRGWQRLGRGEQTIQGKIEAVLSEMTGDRVEVIGCSRTDAGVHALAQVVNVHLKEELPEQGIQDYLNRYLPKDISVTSVGRVYDRFHARYNAGAKTYLYKIWNEARPNPFMRSYSMHVPEPLDQDKMASAAIHFIGAHDFTAYSNAKSKKKSMVREIYSIDFAENDGLIEIRIKGSGFLHNMVRKMVGTLIRAGLDQLDPEAVPLILDSKDRNRANRLADACGLYLEKIEY